MSAAIDRAQRDADTAIADLVQAAKEESFEEGKTEGRQEARDELADLVERMQNLRGRFGDDVIDEVASAIRDWKA